MGRIADALAKAERERKKLRGATEYGTHIVTPRDLSGIDPHIVSYTDPQCTISEQYRMLRTNLLALNSGRPIRALVMTSAIKREGKTVTVLNLAAVMATDEEKKVVAIDCDLRRPRVHTLLGMDSRPGLAELLRGEVELEAALHKARITNLTVLPAGKPPSNPSEQIGSSRMRHLIGELKDRFDYLLFDTPPVMAVTDAGVLGAMVDGVILVIKTESTKRNVVMRAQTLLRGANARLVGCVLTNIREFSPYYIYSGK
jgi:capsular exopolysaccharide synthesis family protein